MQPAIKTQVTAIRDSNKYSDESGIACTPEEDKTEQQWKAEADIHTLLRRFGIEGRLDGPQRVPSFKPVDYDVELQHALGGIQQAREAYDLMPQDLKREYPTLMHFLAAIERRELTVKLPLDKPTDTPQPPAPPTRSTNGA